MAAIVAAKASGHDYTSQPGRLTILDHVLSPVKLCPWSKAKVHVTKHIGHVVLWEHSMLGNAPDRFNRFETGPSEVFSEDLRNVKASRRE